MQPPQLKREGYLQMVTRLEPAIAPQLEAVRRVMEGQDPASVSLVYAVDITGNEQKVCVNCGRDICPNYAVQYRTQNLEADLLADSVVVFMEVATRLGINFGVMAYDEDPVPLREVGPPGNGTGDRSEALSRFNAFRYRHEYPDPRNRAWLDGQLRKWTPADRVKPARGEPDDRTAIRVGTRMLNEGGVAGPRGIIIAKGQVPSSSLKGFQASAKTNGVFLSGLALGKQANAIARSMGFTHTAISRDMHGARDAIGDRITDVMKKATGRDDS